MPVLAKKMLAAADQSFQEPALYDGVARKQSDTLSDTLSSIAARSVSVVRPKLAGISELLCLSLALFPHPASTWNQQKSR